eukprot:scaffold1522_cov174-Ochromonas_danica.AAC.7
MNQDEKNILKELRGRIDVGRGEELNARDSCCFCNRVAIEGDDRRRSSNRGATYVHRHHHERLLFLQRKDIRVNFAGEIRVAHGDGGVPNTAHFIESARDTFPAHFSVLFSAFHSNQIGCSTLGAGPMGMLFAAEWIGIVFFSIFSEPFFATSKNHRAALICLSSQLCAENRVFRADL